MRGEESIQKFAVKLKQAARHCEFGATLDQMLVNQFIAGVRSPASTEKILDAQQGLELTFTEAVEMATATEACNIQLYRSTACLQCATQ